METKTKEELRAALRHKLSNKKNERTEGGNKQDGKARQRLESTMMHLGGENAKTMQVVCELMKKKNPGSKSAMQNTIQSFSSSVADAHVNSALQESGRPPPREHVEETLLPKDEGSDEEEDVPLFVPDGA